MSESTLLKQTEIQKGHKSLFNPFPGLRPFSIDESHLFFGREGQSDEVLHNLSRNRFVAVIGASGSGKSSLMYCGLVPILHGGFITEAGSNWKVITTRPGNGPISNLAEALVKSTIKDRMPIKEQQNRSSIIESLLRRSSLGLVESVKQFNKNKNENILLLVDQFEELFRYKKGNTDKNSVNESFAFVKLIMECVKQTEQPIYVVMTMRSDFIGECSHYQELTKMINDSHYLIPQMTRDNLKEAIIGPIAVGGGTISPRLLHQLLNDVGDNPDQLPILQHSLMRTWDYWERHKKGAEALDVTHYEAIGRMEKALSEHANEAFDELSTKEKGICEHLFKSLTERGGDNRGIRRPTGIAEICSIAKASPEEVIRIVEVFRKPGRSFLSPASEVKLNENSIVDISHESLMRIWDKLKIWVEEEAAAVQMYLRLSEAAAMYQLGETGLWRPPDLHLATAWKRKQQPTLTWAKRYNPAYERTMVYLETSEKEFKSEEENKIRLQKRALRRSRIFAIVLGTAAIVSLGFMVYAIVLQIEAKKQEEKATEQQIIAERQKNLADKKSKEAEEQKEIANRKTAEALKQKEEAEKQKLIADNQRQIAEASVAEALRQKEVALTKTNEANEQRQLAEESTQEALDQKSTAEKATEQAYNLRMLSISQSMAVKSLQMDENQDPDQKALLAFQAYKFNDEYGGVEHNNDVYNGLYYSLKSFHDDDYKVMKGHSDAIRSLVFIPGTNKFFSSSSDGTILKWNLNERTETPAKAKSGNDVVRAMKVSNDGKILACANESGNVEIYDVELMHNAPIVLEGHKDEIWTLAISPDNKYLFSAGMDSTVMIWNIAAKKGKVLAKTTSRILSVAVAPDQTIVAVGTRGGKILLWDYKDFMDDAGEEKSPLTALEAVTLYEEKGNIIQTIAYNKDGSVLASGDRQGNIIIWNTKRRRLQYRLGGHNARMSDIEFSPDNSIMASSSFDGTILLWKTDNYNLQPIVLKDHESWVYTMAFSSDGKSVITGCVDSRIKEWAVSSKMMAEDIKSKITRNMTQKEWENFVGKDIEYEKSFEIPPKEENENIENK